MKLSQGITKGEDEDLLEELSVLGPSSPNAPLRWHISNVEEQTQSLLRGRDNARSEMKVHQKEYQDLLLSYESQEREMNLAQEIVEDLIEQQRHLADDLLRVKMDHNVPSESSTTPNEFQSASSKATKQPPGPDIELENESVKSSVVSSDRYEDFNGSEDPSTTSVGSDTPFRSGRNRGE